MKRIAIALFAVVMGVGVMVQDAEAAKRLGIVYTPVFGGFSDKTLSDRIHDAGARIVITADGGYRNAQIVPFKTAYTDPALDDYVPVATVRGAIAQRRQHESRIVTTQIRRQRGRPGP